MSLSPPHLLVSAWKQALEWETFPDLLHISDCWFLLSGLRRWMTSEGFLTSFFLFSYLQSCTPRCYASQPAVLSRAGGGGVQLQPAGISQTCQSNRWTGARFKVQWRAQVVATLPEHFPHNATLRSPHSRRVGVVEYKHTCIHAGLHKRIHTPNIRGRHAQTVETESFTEGGIKVFSQLGD